MCNNPPPPPPPPVPVPVPFLVPIPPYFCLSHTFLDVLLAFYSLFTFPLPTIPPLSLIRPLPPTLHFLSSLFTSPLPLLSSFLFSFYSPLLPPFPSLHSNLHLPLSLPSSLHLPLLSFFLSSIILLSLFLLPTPSSSIRYRYLDDRFIYSIKANALNATDALIPEEPM